MKNSQFRVFNSDGVWIDATPQHKVSLAVYTERFPIPETLTYRSSEHGVLTELVIDKSEIKKGIIREFDSEILISVHVALGLHKWLSDNLPELIRKEKDARAKTNASLGIDD